MITALLRTLKKRIIKNGNVLPDGEKEYPRESPRVIGFIEAQCKKQEENVEVERGEWMDQCKSEAEVKAKELDNERLFYKRGVNDHAWLTRRG